MRKEKKEEGERRTFEYAAYFRFMAPQRLFGI